MLGNFAWWQLGSVSVQRSPYQGGWFFVEPLTPVVRLSLPVLLTLPLFSILFKISICSLQVKVLLSLFFFFIPTQFIKICCLKKWPWIWKGNHAIPLGAERAITSYNFRQHFKKYQYFKINNWVIFTLNHVSKRWVFGNKTLYFFITLCPSLIPWAFLLYLCMLCSTPPSSWKLF